MSLHIKEALTLIAAVEMLSHRQITCVSGRIRGHESAPASRKRPGAWHRKEPSMQPHGKPELRERAFALAAKGWRGTDIATELGVSKAIVSKWLDPRNDNERGYCACGCGERTNISVNTWKPRKYVIGHGKRGLLADDYAVDSNTGCWLWQRSLTRKGYGALNRDGTGAAHRWYYERHVGPIPAGLTLDHLCRNKRCVNPEHLEPVTAAENSRRGQRDRKAARCST